jgi:outer membrane protein assembly complex protein YaeT
MPASSGAGLHTSFEGNRYFSSKELSGAVAASLADIAGNRDPRAAVDDAAFDIEVLYRSAGFASCHVDWSVEGRGEEVQAHFVVHEGPLVTIAGVEFSGLPAGAPPEEELAAFFGTRREYVFSSKDPLFVEDEVQSGARGMERVLRASGWFQASVAPPEIQLPENSEHATIRVAVVAGPRFSLAAMPEIDTPLLAGQCAKALEEKWKKDRVGKPYDPRWASELRGTVLDVFARNGHPDASAEVTSEVSGEGPDHRTVHLRCTVDPGPVVQVAAVRFRGNQRTKEPFLRSRLSFDTPRPFDGGAIDEGVRRLYETGVFRTVNTRLEGSGEERELVVDLEEANRREFYVEPGYGSYELLRVRLGARERNVFGTGQDLHGEAKVAQRAQKLEVGLADPWFLHTPLASDLSFEYERREEPSFTSTSRGGAFLLTHHPTQTAPTTIFGYQFRHSDLESDSIDVSTLEEASEDVDIGSLRFTRRYDTVDYLFRPSKGHFLELGTEYGDSALGSELDFFRATGTLSLYRKWGELWVGAGSIRGGWITPLGDDDVIPLQERFFNGGENSVRSFQESELGPKDDDGDPLGGEGFGTLNLELRRAIFGSFQLAVFADAGYVVPDHRDFFNPTSANTGEAIGVGVRYLLPIGPLRVDLGYNPDRDPGEDEYVVHFSLGMAF